MGTPRSGCGLFDCSPPWLPAPLPARRAYRPEGRSFTSESATEGACATQVETYHNSCRAKNEFSNGLGQGFWISDSGLDAQGAEYFFEWVQDQPRY